MTGLHGVPDIEISFEFEYLSIRDQGQYKSWQNTKRLKKSRDTHLSFVGLKVNRLKAGLISENKLKVNKFRCTTSIN